MTDTRTQTHDEQIALRRKCDDFIRAHVNGSLTRMVGYLISLRNENPSTGLYDYEDELDLLAYGKPNYEGAATDAGWDKVDIFPEDSYFRGPDEDDKPVTSEAATWQHLCEEQEIDTDDYRREPITYLLVSDYLGHQLREHGEAVVDEILGVGPIWGRPTFGQMIAMDYVIERIVEEQT